MSAVDDWVPASLDLPSHLQVHKYFFVCSIAIVTWDFLINLTRTYKVVKNHEIPAELKSLFAFLRIFLPIEFTIVAVAFYDVNFSQKMCQHFFLFEPICTAILLAGISATHVIQIYSTYKENRAVLSATDFLCGVQIALTALCCGFYRSAPLLEGQGCIAAPKYNWVGLYWLAPTLLYTFSFGLALRRFLDSLEQERLNSKPRSLWKLLLQDSLTLYATILAINVVNVLVWFTVKPTGIEDPIRTIVTGMTAVVTTSMSLRIILSNNSSVEHGTDIQDGANSPHGANSHDANS